MYRACALAAVYLLACHYQPGVAPTSDSAGSDQDAHPDGPAPDAGAMPACATDPRYAAGPATLHRYRVADTVDYDTAIDRCTADGAHLAVIDDAAENTYVATLNTNDVWIGLDDLTKEGTFTWVTGAASTFRGFVSPEPNNSTNEDCTYLRSNGTWNDTKCSDTRPAICECDPTYHPPPTPLCRSQPGAVAAFGRRYFIHLTPATWDNAEAICAATGATLFVPADIDENNAIDGLFISDNWIGYSDQITEGTFEWVNHAPPGYTHWGGTSPSTSAVNTNDCVVLNITWNDITCASTKPYACECDPLPP